MSQAARISSILRGALVLSLAALAPCAQAAGGHHSVDDAAILDADTCEAEGWWLRAPAAGERRLHTGLGCRVGAVELGLAAERTRDPSAHQSGYAAQLKWAGAVAPALQVGFSITPSWKAHAPRYQGTTVAALATWKWNEALTLHANLGRDFLRGQAGEARSGTALEWAPASGWSLIAERYRESGAHYLRMGARWWPTEGFSLDLSRAQRLHGSGVSQWTAGATWTMKRP